MSSLSRLLATLPSEGFSRVIVVDLTAYKWPLAKLYILDQTHSR
jgi:hypothetical protein